MKRSLAILIVGGLATGALAAVVVVWDGLALPLEHWKTADGITVRKENDALVLRSNAAEYGWATVEDRWPATATTRTELTVAAVTNGQLNVQVEWFSEAGEFVSATNAWEHLQGSSTYGGLVSRFQPAGDKARAFRLKLWLEGRQATATLSRLRVTSGE